MTVTSRRATCSIFIDSRILEGGTLYRLKKLNSIVQNLIICSPEKATGRTYLERYHPYFQALTVTVNAGHLYTYSESMAILSSSHLPIIARSDATTVMQSQPVAKAIEATPTISTAMQTPTITSVVDAATASAGKGLSTGAKAGIGAGVTIIALGIISIAIFFALKHIRHRRHVLRMQALRHESERGMRNVAAFQLALPPQFLEREDTSGPPRPPPKPPKPVAKPPTKRGLSWMNEKEAVVDWRANMGKSFSRWRDKPGLNDFDPQSKNVGSSVQTSDSWV